MARKANRSKAASVSKAGATPVRRVAPADVDHDEDVVEAEAVRLEPDAEEPVDAPTDPVELSSYHEEEEPLDEAVAESRLPGIDEEGAASGPLVPYDPLNRYLAEIRRFPLLSREEETAIAHRYVQNRDPNDAYRLVTANLRLVVKIANEFARASRNLLDLIQEGNVGLMEAVKNFDPYRGIRFPSYAVWWVRAYIYRYLINNWRLVKIGTTQAQRKLFFNLRKETERLEAEGFTAQPKLLAQRMGVKESEVREMQDRMAQSEVSLDQPASPDDDTRLIDALPDNALNPEEATARAQWRNFAHEQVEAFAQQLKDKELEIFRSRLMAEEPPTLQEIGDRLGVSRERVRQIETRLKQRLREFLQERAEDIDHAET
ncbi:MAG TPA: RNA polymerase factor sigma-32 [Candidatus Binataceae bacterium]|nr:RNA polymerase factor sigma-32 [Candidatus Binataceae bacterium]